MTMTVTAPGRTCQLCKQWKTNSEFHKNAKGIGGLQSRCKTCAIEVARANYRANPERYKAKAAQWRADNLVKARRGQHHRRLVKDFALTFDIYEQMLERQDGLCAICGVDSPGGRRMFFCVDHDHATGRIRGLLCANCNVGLARLGDGNVRMLGRAIAYVGGSF